MSEESKDHQVVQYSIQIEVLVHRIACCLYKQDNPLYGHENN